MVTPDASSEPSARVPDSKRGLVDWAELLRLRVPASLLGGWGEVAPVELRLLAADGELVARFGPEVAGVCVGGCGVAVRGGARVVACAVDGALRHLVAPVELGRNAAGIAVSGAFLPEAPRGGGLEAAAPTIPEAVLPVLLYLVELAAREMALYWRGRRGSGQAAERAGLIGQSLAIFCAGSWRVGVLCFGV